MSKVGEIVAELKLRNENFKKGMDEARRDMEGMNRDSEKTKKGLEMVEKSALAMGVAVVAAIGGTTMAAANFEQSMARVKAISGATDEEFARLEQTARELGASTVFSATEAAEALQYLSMAGFSVNDSISAMPAVLDLAASAQVDLGLSADIVSNIMTGFGISATETGHAVDVLTKAMTTANTDLPQLGGAMSYVAPVAKSMGLSIEETAAAIAKMSDAGIQGERAGTALRAALLSLANPTGQTKDAVAELGLEFMTADGAMKPLPELIGHIASKLEGMGEAQRTAAVQQLVGTEAASGFIALLDVGQDALANYTKELENSAGTAQRMAEVQMDTLKGSFEEFQGALEEVGISIGEEFIPIFRQALDAGTNLVEMFGDMDMSGAATALTMAAVFSAVALLGTGFVKLASTVRVLYASMGPTGWLIFGLSTLAALSVGVASDVKAHAEAETEAAKANMERAKALQEEVKSTDELINSFEGLREKSKLSDSEMGALVDTVKRLETARSAQETETLNAKLQELADKSGISVDELKSLVEMNEKIIETAPTTAKAVTEEGNAYVLTTDAIRGMNEEKRKQLELEMRSQLNKTDSKLLENLRKQKEIIAETNVLVEKENKIRENISKTEEERKKVKEIIKGLEDGSLSASEYDLGFQKIKLNELEKQLGTEKDKLSTLGEETLEKQKQLGKINQQIDMNNQAREQLVQILLAQHNLTASKDQALTVVQQEIDKLKEQKKVLEETTPANQKNTAEYRNQIKEIESKLSGLGLTKKEIQQILDYEKNVNKELAEQNKKEGEKNSKKSSNKNKTDEQAQAEKKHGDEIGKSKNKEDALGRAKETSKQKTNEAKNAEAQRGKKIQENTVKAGTLNRELGKDVKKEVKIDDKGKPGKINESLGKRIVKEVVIRTIGNLIPGFNRHTGGPVQNTEIPKFHTGGSPNLMYPRGPMFNELDVRLLDNEMVLTQSQQANLFRMLDTYQGKKEGLNNADVKMLIEINKKIADHLNEIKSQENNLYMDGKEIAKRLSPHIEAQNNRSARNRGIQ